MKKLFYILFITCFIISPTYAIKWQEFTSLAGQKAYIDIDSISQVKSYYYFNLRFNSDNGEDIVGTIQASVSHPFANVIKKYTPQEYDNLKGNYKYITDNSSKNLQPVSYESRVFMAYNIVKKEIQKINKPKITF